MPRRSLRASDSARITSAGRVLPRTVNLAASWTRINCCSDIPFFTFSWRSCYWSYGHPLPSDLPLLFGGSPKVGLGLYNSMSAVEATALEFGMFILGGAVYATCVAMHKKIGRPG